MPILVPRAVPMTTPQPVVHRLSNGLRVVLIERHDLPVVTLYALFGAGAEADPPALPGTAQMVAGLLSEGTTHRSAFAIAQAMDQAGGTIDTGAGWDESFVNVGVLSDHKVLAFDLLSDMVIHPAFAPDEIERIREQTLSGLDVVMQDPSYIADMVLQRFLFAGTSYGHSEDGNRDAMSRVKRGDLVTFHDRNYIPSRMILAVVGDISESDCWNLTTKFFGEWESREAAQPEPVTPASASRGKQIIVIDKPDAVQTEIRVGNLAVARSSPDYYALTVANQILGGPAENRLFAALRTRGGLTYGASSNLELYLSAGAWVAKTSTRSPQTIQALKMVLDQIRQMRGGRVQDEEIEASRNYLTGHQALEFESPAQVADKALELMLYGLPFDYWKQFPQKVGSIDADDVAAATRKYLDPDDAVIVLVGNASAFRKELQKIGPAREIPIADLNTAFPENQQRTVAHSTLGN